MPNANVSLLSGRNGAPLTPDEIRRAINTFLGLDNNVNARHEPDCVSAFWVRVDDTGARYGEVVFGPDIYPGPGVVDANSALSLKAAAAHELTHYHRWNDRISLSVEGLEHIDEALTSLQAISRYDRHLSETDVRQLVSDAIQRLQIFVRERAERAIPVVNPTDHLAG